MCTFRWLLLLLLLVSSFIFFWQAYKHFDRRQWKSQTTPAATPTLGRWQEICSELFFDMIARRATDF